MGIHNIEDNFVFNRAIEFDLLEKNNSKNTRNKNTNFDVIKFITNQVLQFSRFPIFILGIFVCAVSSMTWAAGPFTTSGNFSVSASGTSGYVVPIIVPPGTAGMQPQLSLSYSSSSGNGTIGMGWSISGLSQITRCPTTLSQDGVLNGITFTNTDRFCIDGKRLVAITDTYNSTNQTYTTTSAYGGNNTEYRTENANFAKIISYSTTGNGPTSFKVWTKGGQILEFGNTVDSAIPAQGKTAIRAWAVNKISDTSGNYITVSYTTSNTTGEAYVQQINYTGNVKTSPILSPYASVVFNYDTTRADVLTAYQAGSISQISHRLNSIQAFSGSNLVKNYKFTYEQSQTSQRSRLKTLTECDGNATTPICKLPLTFTYLDNQNVVPFSTTYTWQSAGGFGTGYIAQNVDMNGDGKSDIYLFKASTGSHMILINNGNGTFPTTYAWQSAASSGTNYSPQLADFNGDGKPDIYLFNSTTGSHIVWLNNGDGTFPSAYFWQSATGSGTGYTVQLADFNGDGKTDIYMFNSTTGSHIIWQNNGLGAFPASYTWQSATGLGTGYISQLGDFNGDGKPDIYMFNTSNGTHVVWLNKPDGTFPSSYTWQSASGLGTGYTSQLGDFNGDGKSDIYLFNSSSGTHALWLGNGGGSFPSSYTWQSVAGKGTGYSSQLVDFNGDGKSDIYMFNNSNGSHITWINNGNASFPTNYSWQSATGTGTGYLAQLGDFNGDGLPDIYLFNTSTGVHIAWDQQGVMADYLSQVDSVPTGTSSPGGSSRISISYKSITDSSVYTRDTGASAAVYPVQDITWPIYVVSSIGVSDGIGGVITTNYQYGGLKLHLLGRGLLGFRYFIESSAATGLSTISFYRQDFPFVGLPLQIEKHQLSNNVLLSLSQNTYLNNDLASGTIISKFPYLSQNVQQVYEVSGPSSSYLVTTTTTVNQYDSYGNLTSMQLSDGLNNSKTTTNIYYNDTTNWLLGRLLRSTVTGTKSN